MSAPCRRRDVGLQQPAAGAAQGQVRLRAAARLGRAPPVGGGPVQQRRLGVVRLGRRPGHDQPPRRGRHAPKLSTSDKDYYRDGFFAQTHDEEVKAPDLELNVLVGIEDVTERVNATSRRAWTTPRPARPAARRWPTIEKEATDKNGLRNDVVTLYQGGQYHLYTYKKYTDVRLVFAPEFDIAFFGGDPDNFEYPRYDLDVCFFRAYEDGKPAKLEHYLKWSADGSKEGDLVFVAGHPGRTDRLNTVASLEYLRDVELPVPARHARRHARRSCSNTASAGPEAVPPVEGRPVQRSRTAARRGVGGLEGLRDAAFMSAEGRRRRAELRARIEAEPEPRRPRTARAWDKIAAGPEGRRADRQALHLPRARLAPSTRTSSTIARDLVRLAEEKTKPNSDRLKEYRESALKSLELKLFSEAPIYPEFEEAKLAHSLGLLEEGDARRPDGRARPARPLARGGRQASSSTGPKLADVAVRQAARRGGQGGDRGLRRPDDQARPGRRRRRPGRPQDPRRRGRGSRGRQLRPDRQGPLRRARETPSTPTPPSPSGWPSASSRATSSTARRSRPSPRSAGPSSTPRRTATSPPTSCPRAGIRPAKSGKLQLDTPLNFVSTADIIGGNSGSPVVNRDNEVVGLIFDGNIQSLVLDFGYDDQRRPGRLRRLAGDPRGPAVDLPRRPAGQGALRRLIAAATRRAESRGNRRDAAARPGFRSFTIAKHDFSRKE